MRSETIEALAFCTTIAQSRGKPLDLASLDNGLEMAILTNHLPIRSFLSLEVGVKLMEIVSSLGITLAFMETTKLAK